MSEQVKKARTFVAAAPHERTYLRRVLRQWKSALSHPRKTVRPVLLELALARDVSPGDALMILQALCNAGRLTLEDCQRFAWALESIVDAVCSRDA